MSFHDCSLSFETGDIKHIISSLKVLRTFTELLRVKVKLRKKMRGDFWLSLKRSIHCKPNPSEVHEPEAITQQRIPQKISDCFQRTSNILSEKHRSGSLIKSLRSSNILSPITHEVVLNISCHGFRTCRCCPRPLNKEMRGPHESRRPTTTPSMRTHDVDCNECNISSSNSRVLMQTDSNNDIPSTLICPKCGEKLKCVDAVETHHVSQHSVIELDEEDSTRQIIETICRASWSNSQTKSGKIESLLKVQNTPRTFARFEEYRQMVKNEAEKSHKKQPRCLADGNELLRFHGTTIACSLGTNGSSSSGLCSSEHCCVCQILKHGSYATNECHGSFGVLTTSTCDKAFESIGSVDSESDNKGPSLRMSVMVCRVIAGRVLYSSLEEIEAVENYGFDSLAEKTSGDSEIEELYVLDARAILPCFVVIYKH
ncbi:uncharacterized protein LOC129307175 isoform X2 [Prosopis cineraria]|uniref:uncharacterized protein LOC129307175 isoform X2 n=1 Tax=Prosopis cineraria TaxID=364024 RepID=UPI00240EEB82|nr:uncharacterized protein LOC129307175 isoform X2 [Prosopis cineraria]